MSSAAVGAAGWTLAERRAPLWLVVYLSVFGSLFFTHLDIYASEQGLLPFNMMLLYLGMAGLLPVLMMSMGELLTAADQTARVLLRNLVPLAIFILWILGHVFFVGRAMLSLSDVDFTMIFPIYHMLSLSIGLVLTTAAGFPRAFAAAGKVTLLVLGTSILIDSFNPGTLSTSGIRGAGFAQNANVAAFNMVAVLAMTIDFRRYRLLDALILLFTAAVVFITMSRTGLMQLTLVSGVYLCFQVGRSIVQLRLLPLIGVAVTVAGLAIAVLVLDQVVAGSALGENEEVRHRLDQLMFRGPSIADDPYRGVLYDHYLRLVMQSPFLGHGTGYTLNIAVANAPFGVGPHSMYLRTWIDTGLWGLVTYIAFLLAVLITMVHRRFVNGAVLVLLVILYGFFSHNLIDNKTCMVLLGMALGQSSLIGLTPEAR